MRHFWQINLSKNFSKENKEDIKGQTKSYLQL